RDRTVTGVQTCALPISQLKARGRRPTRTAVRGAARPVVGEHRSGERVRTLGLDECDDRAPEAAAGHPRGDRAVRVLEGIEPDSEIGRASCRERVWVAVI